MWLSVDCGWHLEFMCLDNAKHTCDRVEGVRRSGLLILDLSHQKTLHVFQNSSSSSFMKDRGPWKAEIEIEKENLHK